MTVAVMAAGALQRGTARYQKSSIASEGMGNRWWQRHAFGYAKAVYYPFVGPSLTHAVPECTVFPRKKAQKKDNQSDDLISTWVLRIIFFIAYITSIYLISFFPCDKERKIVVNRVQFQHMAGRLWPLLPGEPLERLP